MPNNPQSLKDNKKRLDAMLKYTTLSTEMIGAILLPALLGDWLDDYFSTSKPYFTLGLTLFGVFASMMLLLLGLKKINKGNGKSNV